MFKRLIELKERLYDIRALELNRLRSIDFLSLIRQFPLYKNTLLIRIWFWLPIVFLQQGSTVYVIKSKAEIGDDAQTLCVARGASQTNRHVFALILQYNFSISLASAAAESQANRSTLSLS